MVYRVSGTNLLKLFAPQVAFELALEVVAQGTFREIASGPASEVAFEVAVPVPTSLPFSSRTSEPF